VILRKPGRAHRGRPLMASRGFGERQDHSSRVRHSSWGKGMALGQRSPVSESGSAVPLHRARVQPLVPVSVSGSPPGSPLPAGVPVMLTVSAFSSSLIRAVRGSAFEPGSPPVCPTEVARSGCSVMGRLYPRQLRVCARSGGSSTRICPDCSSCAMYVFNSVSRRPTPGSTPRGTQPRAAGPVAGGAGAGAGAAAGSRRPV
jgi:hypothetical protein